jgi:hypothetical protein
MIHRNGRTVEFQTPPNAQGLGATQSLHPAALPITAQ